MDGTGDLFEPFIQAVPSHVGTTVVRYPGDSSLGYSELLKLAKASLPTDCEYFLLGESFSGPIAVLLAAERPPGMRGLVLSCSFVKNPVPLVAPFRFLLGLVPAALPPGKALNWSLLGKYATPALELSIRAAMKKVSPRAMHVRLRTVMDVDVTEDARRVGVPTLYLRATEDRLVPRGASRLVKEVLPNVEVLDIPGPHFLLQTQPSRCAAAITGYMTETLSGEPIPSG